MTDFGMARDVQQENIYERKTRVSELGTKNNYDEGNIKTSIYIILYILHVSHQGSHVDFGHFELPLHSKTYLIHTCFA